MKNVKPDPVTKEDMEYIARLEAGGPKRIHFTHFTVPKLPWHGDDHKFGETSTTRVQQDSERKVEGSLHTGAPSAQRDTGLRYCHCGDPGEYRLDRWYCEDCWQYGGDE